MLLTQLLRCSGLSRAAVAMHELGLEHEIDARAPHGAAHHARKDVHTWCVALAHER